MPKISIIVPIYNVEKYIRDCMESLVNQTFPDIEIICVDDRGSDNSMKIVKEFANVDPRIRVIRNWRNRGLSYSRNHAMKYVHAPYVMYCDSDDMFALDMCQIMLTAIETSGADVAVCGTQVLYETNHDLKESDDLYFPVQYSGTYNITRSDNNVHYCTAWGKIYRADIIRQHELKFPVGLKYEDEFFWAAYLLWISKITFVKEQLYIYRRREGSIMNVAYRESKLDTDPINVAKAYYYYCNKHGVFHEKANWYWGQWFPHMFGTSVRFSGENNRAACIRHVYKFIRKNYDMSGLDLSAIRMMEDVKAFIKKFGNITV